MNNARWRRAVVVVLALTTASCASSLQRSDEARVAAGPIVDDDGTGFESGSTSKTTAVDGGDAIGADGLPAPVGPDGKPLPELGGVTPTPTETSGTAPLAMGRGVTADSIKVGVIIIDWAGLQNVQGYSTGNPRIQTQAVADYINSQGGIRGRKLQLVFEEMSAGSSNIEADEQRMCAAFTEDHKVFAAIAGMMTMGKTMIPCLARNDTPFIHGAGGLHDRRYFDELGPYLFYPGGPSLTRMARFYVDGLDAQGFFNGDVKVGLVHVDDAPFNRAVAEVLKPRLSQLGIKLVEEAAVQAQTSLGDTASRMSNVTLRFQQRGINRVLFLDNAQLGALFAIQASQTNYYPRYGLNTTTLPNTMQNNVPPRALQGSIGVGWQAAIDVNRAYEDVTPAAEACYGIMAAAGQSNVDRSGEWSQRNFCDELLFIDFALERAGALTAAGLAASARTAGTSFPSALNWHADFKGGRPDGASTVRFFAFIDKCSCFQYTSPQRGIG